MSRHYAGWAPYVPVATRRRQAERALETLRKQGETFSPVRIAGRRIATTFWGSAWCDNLESYHDYQNRLPRGRTYVRNGSVVDLRIAAREVTATVSGSSMYKVKITIGEVAKVHWQSICADCSGGIDSLVELLQGRLSKGVMERICRQGAGLFPKPSEIRFTCSCPDYASMCKHVAATLYGVGARLDATPELLFRLRAVNETDLVADIGHVLPMTRQGQAAGKVLEADDMAALFSLDMADAAEVVAPPTGERVLAAGEKSATGVRPDAGKQAAAKKAARAAAAASGKDEPAPVEWWKPGALKQAQKACGRKAEAVRPKGALKASALGNTSAPGKARESRKVSPGREAGPRRKAGSAS